MPRRKLVMTLLPLVLVSLASSVSAEKRGVKVVPTQAVRAIPWGDYYVLVIGINQYREWPHLRTAVNDVKGLKSILVNRYGFADERTILLTDGEATRGRILNDLRKLASNLKETDNLLVYFAGHGQLDDLTGEGYWIPAEGKQKDPVTWVSHSDIKNILCSERVRAKNVVVVADSCYSGTLLRGGPSLLSLEDMYYRGRLAELASKRSRQVITSGGLEPVVDGGRDGHSLFAYYFIKALEENQREIIDLENLFHGRVWKPVTEIGGQRPSVGRLKTPMDEDGQFVLELKLKVTIPQSAVTTGTPQQDKQLAEERERLVRERREVERLKLEIEKKRIEGERKRLEEEKARLQTASIPARPQQPPPTGYGKEVGRDGKYVAYGNGIVRDTKTGLEWVAGPNKDTTWDEAKAWVESLNVAGGGWRMPTVHDLERLYTKGEGSRNMTPLLKTTGWWVWAGDLKDSSEAWAYHFSGGWHSIGRYGSNVCRAFAVRSHGEGKWLEEEKAKLQTASIPTRLQQPPPTGYGGEVGRDGVYIAYANGIVSDTKTGLEWVAGPGRDMTWDEAKKWIESLSVGAGGWRMPTIEELQGLYEKERVDIPSITPLLKTTGLWLWVWSGELEGPWAAWFFNFANGDKYHHAIEDALAGRAFAVRSRSGG
ncbi:MAG: DUF1566 domain-containing protein [Deltaproteobacteria bacterium]|nr:DUF1566 domain-containing protein [Deltaproteobacteria bacterium]